MSGFSSRKTTSYKVDGSTYGVVGSTRSKPRVFGQIVYRYKEYEDKVDIQSSLELYHQSPKSACE